MIFSLVFSISLLCVVRRGLSVLYVFQTLYLYVRRFATIKSIAVVSATLWVIGSFYSYYVYRALFRSPLQWIRTGGPSSCLPFPFLLPHTHTSHLGGGGQEQAGHFAFCLPGQWHSAPFCSHYLSHMPHTCLHAMLGPLCLLPHSSIEAGAKMPSCHACLLPLPFHLPADYIHR